MKRLVPFLFALFSTSAFAVEMSPRILIHLLDYVALDYGGAIGEGGKIVSETEYAEMKEFAGTIAEGAKSLDVSIVDATTLQELEAVRKLVLDKAAPAQVAIAARQAQGHILAKARIDVAPKRWPDLKEGATLFAKNCAQCHGAEGRGDGPSAAGLDPKPSNFFDAERMGEVSPFHAFNVVRLGVQGTAMAAFADLSDQQAWALAFYVVSLRHAEAARVAGAGPDWNVSLERAASHSDNGLLAQHSENKAQSEIHLARLRNHSETAAGGAAYLRLAQDRLRDALSHAGGGDFDGASQAAIQAYLDGVEPVEPTLRAKNADFVARLEEAMLAVRQSISERIVISAIEQKVASAERILGEAERLLETKDASPGFTFGVAFGVFLREGFEAILIIVTLLGIIRAIGSTRAAWYVHGGWFLALVVGIAGWFFSGVLVQMSSVSREVMEGGIALFAVAVLLYFGFWLHRKVQIERWRAFLEQMTRTAVEGRKLLGLGIVAFMAVFREAFETILFLRALSLEPGTSLPTLWAGVGVSFVVILILSIALVRFSVKIPIRQLFSLSSWVVWLLAFVLSGKAIHSFQESGLIPATALPWNLRLDLIGLFPTYETTAAQAVVLLVGGLLFYLGSKPPRLKPQAASGF